jgi:taurine dioxygenase
MEIQATGRALGARVEGIDLARPVSDGDFKKILRALGAFGVLCFPEQRLETDAFARFSRMFGELEINVANQFHEPGFPEVMVLSNMTQDGKPIGLGDAGQGWHTDMSYSKDVALANVLYAIKVPMRDGRPLGDTVSKHAPWLTTTPLGRIEAPPRRPHGDTRLRQVLGHDALPPGSQRAPLTAEQRAKKPPVSQPIFRTHPITGRTILYCNPGYAMCIDGLPEAESSELLEFLFKLQGQENISTPTSGPKVTC